MLNWISEGFRRAAAHKRLVLLFWAVTALPMFLWALSILPTLLGDLGNRPFAEGFLGPEAFNVWIEYMGSGEGSFGGLVQALPILVVLGWLLQVMAAAGAVPWLLAPGHRPGDSRPSFAAGVRRFTVPFLRSALAFFLVAGLWLVALGLVMALGGQVAEQTGDELWKLRFLPVTALVGLLLFAPLDLAYDLSRIAAVRHGGRQTFRGYYRALGWVLKRPVRLVPFYVAFTLLIFAGAGLAFFLRSPWAPVTVAGILALVLLRQLFVLLRSYLSLSFWAAEAASYEALEEPDFCRGSRPEEPAPAAAAPVPALGSPPAVEPEAAFPEAWRTEVPVADPEPAPEPEPAPQEPPASDPAPPGDGDPVAAEEPEPPKN